MNVRTCIPVGLVLVVLASTGCRRDPAQGQDQSKEQSKEQDKDQSGKIEKVVLGQVRVGKESAELYIAYAPDAAVLGFSVSTGGPAQYYPMYASTHRGIPTVVLDVFASKSEEEMWVRSSLPGGEILAYHRIGTDAAITQFGNVKFLQEPMPPYLSGGPVPFPELVMENVVKKATFKHD